MHIDKLVKNTVLLSLLCAGMISGLAWASHQLPYQLDKFTGEETLTVKLWPTEKNIELLITSGNAYQWILEHKKKHPVRSLLKADFDGVSSSVKRFDTEGNYIPKASLLILVDGEKRNYSYQKS